MYTELIHHIILEVTRRLKMDTSSKQELYDCIANIRKTAVVDPEEVMQLLKGYQDTGKGLEWVSHTLCIWNQL